ncbi:hypothetical protein ACI2L1_12030 [Streptomyces sp. NPDC019531]|uniref:hypothetical protein n=1 Tax=Streptomyces sp. NPDC019531 TaxID=3365062 RepID=UPI00384E1F07
MSAATATVTAGGAQLVGAPGRPARPEESGQGEHVAESVLSLTSGAGPELSTEGKLVSRRPPARPVRFDDPARNAAYWARIDAIVDSAPPLTDEQRAVIRTAFHQPEARRAAA